MLKIKSKRYEQDHTPYICTSSELNKAIYNRDLLQKEEYKILSHIHDVAVSHGISISFCEIPRSVTLTFRNLELSDFSELKMFNILFVSFNHLSICADGGYIKFIFSDI